jgi:hypothetical protein
MIINKNFLYKYFFLVIIIYFFSSPAFHLELKNSHYIESLHYQAENFFLSIENPTAISHRLLFPLFLLILNKTLFFTNLSLEAIHIILINIIIIITIFFIWKNFYYIDKKYAFYYSIIFCSTYNFIGQISFPYYPDPLTVLLILLAYFYSTKNFWISTILLFLSFLSHEIAIAAAPLILYKQFLNKNFNRIKILTLFFFSLFLYIFIAFTIFSNFNQPDPDFYKKNFLFSFNLSNYVDHFLKTINKGYAGIFFSFKILWVLVVISFINHKKIFKSFSEFIFYLILVSSAVCINFLFVTDITRHISLILFIIIFSILQKLMKSKKFNFLIVYFSFVQLFLPNIFVWYTQAYFINPGMIELLVKKLLVLIK